MIDFHSHILPGIDDGSRSLQESLELIKMLKAQNVDLICATPHYSIRDKSPDAFLEDRKRSYESLLEVLPGDAPKICVGAEVFYSPGISHMKELPKLCFEGTRLLLLEMPTDEWTGSVYTELRELSCSSNIIIMMAHIERYLPMQKAKLIEDLLNYDILFQCNASFFNDKHTRKKALKMLKNGQISAIGSDCHNVVSRPPRLDEFAETVKAKYGEDFLRGFEEAQVRLLEDSA